MYVCTMNERPSKVTTALCSTFEEISTFPNTSGMNEKQTKISGSFGKKALHNKWRKEKLTQRYKEDISPKSLIETKRHTWFLTLKFLTNKPALFFFARNIWTYSCVSKHILARSHFAFVSMNKVSLKTPLFLFDEMHPVPSPSWGTSFNWNSFLEKLLRIHIYIHVILFNFSFQSHYYI